MNTSSKNEVIDLLIVGAGVAGSAVALSCPSTFPSIILLHSPDNCDRIESLSPDASRRLSQYSIHSGVPYSEVFAWWGSTQRSIARCPGARITSRRELAIQIRDAASKFATVLNCKSNLGVTRNNENWEITFFDALGVSRLVLAKHICDATGRRSAVGRAIGAHRKSFDHLCCLSVSVSDANHIGTFTEAVSNGWWNLCSDGVRGTLGFYSTPRIIKQLKGDLRNLFAKTNELRKVVSVRDDSKAGVSICDSSLLSPCAGRGWFAVGDAAATFQPITSTGIAKALRDARNVLSATENHGDQYSDQYATEFQGYLKELQIQYGFENRWRGSEFWK